MLIGLLRTASPARKMAVWLDASALRVRTRWLACVIAIQTIRRRDWDDAWPTSGLSPDSPPGLTVTGRHMCARKLVGAPDVVVAVVGSGADARHSEDFSFLELALTLQRVVWD